ncbi:hypothetical protein Tco_0097624 [Tanacetum coccineum]
MKFNLQDQAADLELWDVLKHNAPPKGEKRAKRKKTLKSSKSSKFARVIDEDEVIHKDTTPELIDEFQNADKHILTIYDYGRMMATLNDMMSNQFKDVKEHAYHLEQTNNYMKNQIYGNTEERSYILSLHKIHVVSFPEEDLEERLKRWVRKEFMTFNKEARLSIHHWKDSWHKRMYNLNQRRVGDNPEEYFSNHRIKKVVRITSNQQHGLDYMEQIIVIRENDKPDSFFEADFKNLNKNDIKYLVNLTAPTLTFPGIEAHDPYSIMDKPNTGLIYLNRKEEKMVMYVAEIIKFCDATLEKSLERSEA